MPQDKFATLNPPTRILKRAQYEAFAFSLVEGGVRVRNESHRNPADHEYDVTVSDGVPTDCECPAEAAFEHPCKHRVAIAVRPRILDLVETVQTVASTDIRPDPACPLTGSETSTDPSCDCAALPDHFPY